MLDLGFVIEGTFMLCCGLGSRSSSFFSRRLPSSPFLFVLFSFLLSFSCGLCANEHASGDAAGISKGRCEEELPEMMLGVHRFDMFAPTKWGVNLDEAIASDARKKTEEAAEQAALESGSVP